MTTEQDEEERVRIVPVLTDKGVRWRWRHWLINNGEWSRLYISEHAARNGMGLSLRHFNKSRSTDSHICVELDGARVHIDPEISPEGFQAIKSIVEAIRKLTPEQIAEIKSKKK